MTLREIFNQAVDDWGESTCGSDERWFIAEAVARHYEAELADAQQRAAMACENPCGDCAGCNLARDLQGFGPSAPTQEGGR